MGGGGGFPGGGSGLRSQDGCEQRIEVFVKLINKKKWGGVRGVRFGGGGGQGGYERRIEVFVKIKKKKKFCLGGGGGGGVRGRGRVGGSGEGSGWRVRVDVNEELKFL